MRVEAPWWLPWLAISLTVALCVWVVVTGFRSRDVSFEKYGCDYMRAIGDAHGMPVDACKLSSKQKDGAVFWIRQMGVPYYIAVNYTNSKWQILSAVENQP